MCLNNCQDWKPIANIGSIILHEKHFLNHTHTQGGTRARLKSSKEKGREAPKPMRATLIGELYLEKTKRLTI